jgi:hypothetical protein
LCQWQELRHCSVVEICASGKYYDPAEWFRSVPVASIKTLQCSSDHNICIKFVAEFLFLGGGEVQQGRKL